MNAWEYLLNKTERERDKYKSHSEKLAEALKVMLGETDYKSGYCKPTQMIGAVLPVILIDKARAALSAWEADK